MLASYIDPGSEPPPLGHSSRTTTKPDILRLCAGSPRSRDGAKKSTDSSDLTICSLSGVLRPQGDQIMDLLTKPERPLGPRSAPTDSLDTNKLLGTAQKIQCGLSAAKLPTVYYCKGIRLQFKADDEFFHCSMELATNADATTSRT